MMKDLIKQDEALLEEIKASKLVTEKLIEKRKPIAEAIRKKKRDLKNIEEQEKRKDKLKRFKNMDWEKLLNYIRIGRLIHGKRDSGFKDHTEEEIKTYLLERFTPVMIITFYEEVFKEKILNYNRNKKDREYSVKRIKFIIEIKRVLN